MNNAKTRQIGAMHTILPCFLHLFANSLNIFSYRLNFNIYFVFLMSYKFFLNNFLTYFYYSFNTFIFNLLSNLRLIWFMLNKKSKTLTIIERWFYKLILRTNFWFSIYCIFFLLKLKNFLCHFQKFPYFFCWKVCCKINMYLQS